MWWLFTDVTETRMLSFFASMLSSPHPPSRNCTWECPIALTPLHSLITTRQPIRQNFQKPLKSDCWLPQSEQIVEEIHMWKVQRVFGSTAWSLNLSPSMKTSKYWQPRQTTNYSTPARDRTPNNVNSSVALLQTPCHNNASLASQNNHSRLIRNNIKPLGP